MAGFTSYFAGPQTLSYNHLTLIFGNLLLTIIFTLFNENITLKKTILLSFFAGTLIGFEFFIKSPISMLFLLLYLVSLVYIFKTNSIATVKNFIVALCSITISVTFICFPISPFEFIKEYLGDLTVVSKAAGHGVNYLFKIYFDGIHVFYESHLKLHLITLFILVISLFFIIQKKYSKIQDLAFVIFIGLLLSLLYNYYSDGYFISGHENIDKVAVILLVILFYSLFIFTAIFLKINNKKLLVIFSKPFFLISTLLIFPVLCSLGTNNYLHIQIIFHINTLILLAYIAFEYLKTYSEKINVLFKIFLSILSIKIVMGVYYSIIIEPYRINGSLFTQTERQFINATKETIYIDKHLKNNLTILKNLITKEQPSAMYCSNDLFGLAYLFDKKLVGYGGFDCNVTETNQFICNEFNNSKIKKGKTLFAFDDGSKNCNAFPCLDSRNFKKLLSIKRNSNSTDTLHFFINSYK